MKRAAAAVPSFSGTMSDVRTLSEVVVEAGRFILAHFCCMAGVTTSKVCALVNNILPGPGQ